MSFPVSILNIRILLLLLLSLQFRNLRFGFSRKFLGLLFCFGNQFVARFLCGDLSQSTLRSSGIDHFLTLFLCGFDQLVTGFFRLIVIFGEANVPPILTFTDWSTPPAAPDGKFTLAT